MNFIKSVFLISCLFISANSIHAQGSDITSFMFGHSLMHHEPPLIPTPSDETTIAHWIYLLATEAGHNYSASGQYGFLQQHDNLPPISQWGYDIVPSAWESDYEPFTAAGFNNALITAANFAQWQGPSEDYYGEPGVSPISATQTIVNWLEQTEPGMNIYIYENWPDMAPFIAGEGFPPTAAELTNYYNYLEGGFHDWWLEYHDSLLISNPQENVRMIPVGPILSELLTNTVLNTIPVTELYEDNAPHGRATLYFLAGMITYMAIYEEQAPLTYAVPSIVHSTVSNNYSMVVNTIWNELLAFNLANGDSRVFTSNIVLSADLEAYEVKEENCSAHVYWKTSNEKNNSHFEIERSRDGILFHNIATIPGAGNSNQSREYRYEDKFLEGGVYYYRIRQVDFDGTVDVRGIRSIKTDCAYASNVEVFPNPTHGELNLIFHNNINAKKYMLINTTGQVVLEKSIDGILAKEALNLDLSNISAGVYYFKLIGADLQGPGIRIVRVGE